MLSRNDIVRATSEQTRAFATLGLLRQVSEATPIDMVCTYIIQTNQPWGLKDKVYDLNDAKGSKSWVTHLSIRNNTNADRVHYFPEGIMHMAKDYLIRAFWKQIDHLRSPSCMRISTDGTAYGDEEKQISRMKVFPKSVLDVLASCHIHHNARLWDAQHAIGALHAVCTPLMLDNPSWMVREHFCSSADMAQFDTLRSNHSRTLGALMSILDNYCWNTNNRSHIPNDAEKNILLDLIECFLVMFGPRPFYASFRVRQIYEFTRIGDIVAHNGYDRRGGCCCNSCSPASFSIPQRSDMDWNNGVVAVLTKLKHLSPESAICLNNIESFVPSISCLRPELLKESRPIPLKEVELYLQAEFNVQRNKKCVADRIREAFQRGEFDNEYFSVFRGYGSDAPCTVCEDPAPCGSDY